MIQELPVGAGCRQESFLSSFKQVAASQTTKGNLPLWVWKCFRFSETRAWAPTNSVYAAMAASPFFKKARYFSPRSKGTTHFSSTEVKALIKAKNSLVCSGDSLLLTSSTIVRTIRMSWTGRFSIRNSSNSSDAVFLTKPKAKTYSLESRTKSRGLLPEFFPDLADVLNHLCLGGIGLWPSALAAKLADAGQMLFGLLADRGPVLISYRYFGHDFFSHLSIPAISLDPPFTIFSAWGMIGEYDGQNLVKSSLEGVQKTVPFFWNTDSRSPRENGLKI